MIVDMSDSAIQPHRLGMQNLVLVLFLSYFQKLHDLVH